MSSTRDKLMQLAQEHAVGGLDEATELLELQAGANYVHDQAAPALATARHQRGDEAVAYWQGEARAYEHRATMYRKALDNLRGHHE